jgi:hypothetical protein
MDWTKNGGQVISARFRPHKLDGLEATFSDIGFRERGRDPLPSLFSASRPGRNSFSLKRDFKLSPQEPERDSVRSCIRPPRPCEPACWPKPRRQHSGECAPTVALTSYSGREPACVAVAVRCVHPERKVFVEYLLPRLLMPSNFCLPPVEYSPGTIPIQAAKFRPF